ncbi:uncharacterized protein CEXT_805761 [Caerostris extrusa]|uniref:Uncharacterized protein n=1 Tax=Caerostris extrusa TaxID=172846 RepID=A0AAV4MY63_CAEEX|nr:uncharacterized protein CEXT_805761 [Caerostris extrusa]
MDHPVFRIAEMSNGEENARSIQNYTPETRYLSSKIQPSLSSKSEIEAEVYTNSTYLSNADLSYQEMAMEEKAYICENAPSNKVFEHTTGKENANIQKLYPIRNSPRVSQLDISDIEYDTVASRNDEIADITSDKPVLSSKPSISRMDSNFEVDDTFFEPSVSKFLAGEVVAVKVNTLPRKHHPSKLIPVPIPVVSNFKNSQKKMQNKRKNTLTTVEIPQIEDDSAREETGKFVRKKVMFSSFRGNIKTKTISNGSSDDEYLKHTHEQCEANTSEAFIAGSIPPSPAHTSGYDSAFDENTQISYSEGFKPNSSSTIRAHTSYSTPQKIYSAPRHLRNMQNISHPEADNLKAFVGRRSSDVPGLNANKELISQLLNDVSFRR